MPRRDDRTNKLNKIIAQNLKEFRVSRGFSRMELAALVGITHQQISKYENNFNKIGADRLYLFAEAFGISMEVFFINDNKPIEKSNKDKWRSTMMTMSLVHKLTPRQKQSLTTFLTEIAR